MAAAAQTSHKKKMLPPPSFTTHPLASTGAATAKNKGKPKTPTAASAKSKATTKGKGKRPMATHEGNSSFSSLSEYEDPHALAPPNKRAKVEVKGYDRVPAADYDAACALVQLCGEDAVLGDARREREAGEQAVAAAAAAAGSAAGPASPVAPPALAGPVVLAGLAAPASVGRGENIDTSALDILATAASRQRRMTG